MKDSSGHSRTRPIRITAVYLVLLTLLIPWYWPEEDVSQLFGFPLWAVVSLAVLLSTSIFTAWLCLRGDESQQ